MHWNRRSLLRDTALLSMAGAVPFLSGCDDHDDDDNEHKHFAKGLRIFFEGAWFFTGDPNHPGRMRAFSLNPPDVKPKPKPLGSDLPDPSDMHHKFPFGRWTAGQNFDDNGTNLPANLYADDTPENKAASRASKVIPHEVYVRGAYEPAFNLDELFRAANTGSSFNYMPNPTRKYVLDWTCPGLRVISVPIPTRLISAGFRKSSTIDDKGGYFQRNSDLGVATTHVLEYRGASTLDLFVNGEDPKNHLQFKASTDSTANLHFHTVPTKCPKPGHATVMFRMLLDRIQEVDSSLVTLAAEGSDEITLGPQVPSSVTLAELDDVPDHCTNNDKATVMVGLTANCAGGGGGVGCGH